MRRLISFHALLAGAVIVATLAGCASPANREAMTAGGLQLGQKHDASVSVTTSAGLVSP